MPDSPPSSPLAVLLLAVVQGVSEFLPISSSGHLVLAHELLNVHEAGLTLDVALHVGTLGAVLWAYRRDVGRLMVDVLDLRLRLALWLVVATIPAGLAGVLLGEFFERAFASTRVAGIGLLGTAALLLLGEVCRRRHQHPPHESLLGDEEPLVPRFSDALYIGGAQVLALLPGVSRSGTTITAALVRGLSAPQAARISFLMSIPAIAGAALLELPQAVSEGFGGLSTGLVACAAVLAGLVGWASLRGLLLVLRRGAFPWLALYCAGVGLLTLALLR